MHPRARCAQVQRTCCETADVLVTSGDLRRIAEATAREDFSEWRRPSDASYLEDDPEDPDWLTLTTHQDGRRPLLRREEGGACTFLGSAGCTLGLETRPLVCRLYPWSYTERGLAGEDVEFCPRELLAAPGQTMLELLDVPRDTAERWRAELHSELRADFQAEKGLAAESFETVGASAAGRSHGREVRR